MVYTPMFRAVKEKYPKAKVLVIGNRVNKEILGGNRMLTVILFRK